MNSDQAPINDEIKPTIDQSKVESNSNQVTKKTKSKHLLFLTLVGLLLIVVVVLAGYLLLIKPITSKELKTANLQSETIAQDVKSLGSSQVYNLNLTSLTKKVLASPQKDINQQLSIQIQQINSKLIKTQAQINLLKKSPVLKNQTVKKAFDNFQVKWQNFNNFVTQLNQSYQQAEPSLLSYVLNQATLLVKSPNITNNPTNAVSFLNQLKNSNQSALKVFQSVKVSNSELTNMINTSVSFINKSDNLITQVEQSSQANNLSTVTSQTKLLLNLEVGYLASIKLDAENLKTQYDNLYPQKALTEFQNSLKNVKTDP